MAQTEATDEYRHRRARQMAADNRREMLRRVRVGNLRKLFHDRYGDTFPEDDAGREDLRELLLPISVSLNAAELKMRDEIERHAPWMTPVESMVLIADIMQTPIRYRMASAKALGKRLNVTNGERERLKLWTIAASNMTPLQALEFRKMKDRERKRRLRALRGSRANSISRTKPWLAAGYRMRRTWERHGKPVSQNASAVRLLNTADKVATFGQSQPPLAVRAKQSSKSKTPTKPRQSKAQTPPCSADKVATLDTLGWQRNAKTPDEKLKPDPPKLDPDTQRIIDAQKQRQAAQARYDRLRKE